MDGADRPIVCICTYNERENLPSLLEAIWQQLPTADVLVVDDNSPDGTGKWCAEQARREPRLHCLNRPAKTGLGAAMAAGLQEALRRGHRWILTLDADWSHNPADLPRLLQAAQERADRVAVVIGSRYVTGGSVRGWPWYRRVMSRAMNRWARGWLRLPVRDTTGALRCYSARFLKRVDWQRVQSQGYSFLEEILWWLQETGGSFWEIPIEFVDRAQGESKITVQDSLGAVRMVLQLGLRTVFSRPRRRSQESDDAVPRS